MDRNIFAAIISISIIVSIGGCTSGYDKEAERWVNETYDKFGLAGCTLSCVECSSEAFSFVINATGNCHGAGFELLHAGGGGPGGSAYKYCFSTTDSALFEEVRSNLCANLQQYTSFTETSPEGYDVTGRNDTSERLIAECLAGGFENNISGRRTITAEQVSSGYSANATYPGWTGCS